MGCDLLDPNPAAQHGFGDTSCFARVYAHRANATAVPYRVPPFLVSCHPGSPATTHALRSSFLSTRPSMSCNFRQCRDSPWPTVEWGVRTRKQCDAVSTKRDPIRVPPQNGLLLLCVDTNATANLQFSAFATWPPTIRRCEPMTRRRSAGSDRARRSEGACRHQQRNHYGRAPLVAVG